MKRLFSWKGGNPPTWMLLGALFMIQLIFGIYPVVLKVFTGQKHGTANTYIFTFYRNLGAIPVLFICSFLFEGKVLWPNLRMNLIFMVSGFVGMFSRQFSYTSGVFAIGPDLCSVFKSLTPMVTIVLAILLRTEKPPSLSMLYTWTKFAGILIAIGGSIKLTMLSFGSDNNEGATGRKKFGYIAIAINVLSGSLFCVLQRKYVFSTSSKWRDYPIAVTGYCYVYGAVFMGLFSLCYIYTGELEQFILPQSSLYAVIYAILISSALCYFLIAWSNKYLPPSIVNVFVPLQIPITVTAEFLEFGDQFSLSQYLMTVLIIAGVLLVLYSSHMESQHIHGVKGGWRLSEYWKRWTKHLHDKGTGLFLNNHHTTLSMPTLL